MHISYKMKTITYTLTIFLSFFLVQGIIAQAPAAFNYQAVIKDANGDTRAFQNITVGFRIRQGGATGSIVYQEQLDTETNASGIINLQIGSTGDLSSVDWSKGPYFLQVLADGNDLGTTQLLSVPYAMYALNSGSSTPGPSPAYEWDGTRIRFQNPDGSFGEFVDLQGEAGNSVTVVGSVSNADELEVNYDGNVGDMIIDSSTGDCLLYTSPSPRDS